jgi:hypothetical protein
MKCEAIQFLFGGRISNSCQNMSQYGIFLMCLGIFPFLDFYAFHCICYAHNQSSLVVMQKLTKKYYYSCRHIQGMISRQYNNINNNNSKDSSFFIREKFRHLIITILSHSMKCSSL